MSNVQDFMHDLDYWAKRYLAKYPLASIAEISSAAHKAFGSDVTPSRIKLVVSRHRKTSPSKMTDEEQRHERREGWIRGLQWAEKLLMKEAQSCFNDNEVHTGVVLERCAATIRDNYIDVVLKMLRDKKGGDTG